MDRATRTAEEIFDIFVSNNVHQGVRYGVGDLAAIDRERHFRYTLAGKRYLAVVARVEGWDGPCVTITIQCPLPEIELPDSAWVDAPSRLMEGLTGSGYKFSSWADGMEFHLRPKTAGCPSYSISFFRREPFDDEPGLKAGRR